MHFWEIIASNAVVSGALAIGITLLSRVWKNPAALHLLWVIVLIKLFTPPIIFSPLPFATKWLPEELTTSSAERLARSLAIDSTEQPSPDAASNARIPDQPVADTNRNSLQHPSLGMIDKSFWSLSTTLATIWIFGSSCVALSYFVRIRRFARLLSSLELPPRQTSTMVNELGRKLGLSRLPKVLMTSHALPPLVWSIGTRPRVILPIELFGRLSGAAQTSIIAHELVHVRRGDHLVRLLELIATTFFWWNPVVWWASSQLHDLEEQCCDSRALELLQNQARTYASALVETLDFLSDHPRVFVPLPTAVHSTGSLARRIQMLTQPRTNRLTAKTCLLVAAIAALPLAIVFASEPAGEPSTGESDNKAAAKLPSGKQPLLTLADSATLKKIEADYSTYPSVLAASSMLKKSVAAGSKTIPDNLHGEVKRSLDDRLAALLAGMQEYKIQDYRADMLATRLLELAYNVTELQYRPMGATPAIRQKANARYADLLVYVKQQLEKNSSTLGVNVLEHLSVAKIVGEAFEDVLQRVQRDTFDYGYGEPLSEEQYGQLVSIVDNTIGDAVQFSSGLKRDELHPTQLADAAKIANNARSKLRDSIGQRTISVLSRYAVAKKLHEKTKETESLRGAIHVQLRRSEQQEMASILRRTHDEAQALRDKAKAFAEQNAVKQ